MLCLNDIEIITTYLFIPFGDEWNGIYDYWETACFMFTFPPYNRSTPGPPRAKQMKWIEWKFNHFFFHFLFSLIMLLPSSSANKRINQSSVIRFCTVSVINQPAYPSAQLDWIFYIVATLFFRTTTPEQQRFCFNRKYVLTGWNEDNM